MQINTDLEQSSFLSPVKNIAVLLLIVGVLNILGSLLTFLFAPLFALIQLTAAIILVVTALGLRRMKRWSLYSYTAITILSIGIIGYSYLVTQSIDVIELIVVIIEILILLYFWKIADKFK